MSIVDVGDAANPTRLEAARRGAASSRCKRRNTIKRGFSLLKHWRRVAARPEKLARNFHVAVTIVAVILWWRIESGAYPVRVSEEVSLVALRRVLAALRG